MRSANAQPDTGSSRSHARLGQRGEQEGEHGHAPGHAAETGSRPSPPTAFPQDGGLTPGSRLCQEEVLLNPEESTTLTRLPGHRLKTLARDCFQPKSGQDGNTINSQPPKKRGTVLSRKDTPSRCRGAAMTRRAPGQGPHSGAQYSSRRQKPTSSDQPTRRTVPGGSRRWYWPAAYQTFLKTKSVC